MHDPNPEIPGRHWYLATDSEGNPITLYGEFSSLGEAAAFIEEGAPEIDLSSIVDIGVTCDCCARTVLEEKAGRKLGDLQIPGFPEA